MPITNYLFIRVGILACCLPFTTFAMELPKLPKNIAQQNSLDELDQPYKRPATALGTPGLDLRGQRPSMFPNLPIFPTENRSEETKILQEITCLLDAKIRLIEENVHLLFTTQTGIGAGPRFIAEWFSNATDALFNQISFCFFNEPEQAPPHIVAINQFVNTHEKKLCDEVCAYFEDEANKDRTSFIDADLTLLNQVTTLNTQLNELWARFDLMQPQNPFVDSWEE